MRHRFILLRFILLFCFVCLPWYGSSLAAHLRLAQLSPSPQEDLAQEELPAAGASINSCLVECEDVYRLCKKICHETKARDQESYGDDPNIPVDACLRDCEKNYQICDRSCQENR
jgi:hypothetical protein